MAIHKVIEVLAFSEKNWEDAAQQAVNDAALSIKNIESIYLEDFSAKIENDQITQYRINAKITFEVDSE